MNGPIKSASQKAGTPTDWLERGIVFAGGLVIVGLLIESWPELWMAIIERRLPNLTVTGGIMVTVGVLAEVTLGIFITQRANRAHAEAIELSAKAALAAAEANLARAKIEKRLARWTVSRNLDADEKEVLRERLTPFAGQRFGITFAETDDIATMEPRLFCSQIGDILRSAKWVEEEIPTSDRVGNGILIECNGSDMGSACGLANALAGLDIQARATQLNGVLFVPQLRIHVGLL